MEFRMLTAFATGVFLLAACSAAQSAQPVDAPPSAGLADPTRSFELTSTAFQQGDPIPPKYSCDGEDVSPPLSWGEPPATTQSLALIMDDPDAPGGTWDHWILFNIPPGLRTLQEDLPVTGNNQNPESIFVGSNSWGQPGYGGPCPPSGTHRYFFKLYALDTTISLLPGATKQELLQAIDGHILAESELMGTFSR